MSLSLGSNRHVITDHLRAHPSRITYINMTHVAVMKSNTSGSPHKNNKNVFKRFCTTLYAFILTYSCFFGFHIWQIYPIGPRAAGSKAGTLSHFWKHRLESLTNHPYISYESDVMFYV